MLTLSSSLKNNKNCILLPFSTNSEWFWINNLVSKLIHIYNIHKISRVSAKQILKLIAYLKNTLISINPNEYFQI